MTLMVLVGAYVSLEVLVVCKPVCFGDDGVGLVEVGEQMQHTGSAVHLVRTVFYLQKVVLHGPRSC